MTLIQQLTEQTQDLKNTYIAQVTEWCKNRFETLQNRMSWKEVDWCNFYGLEPRKANEGKSNEFLSFPTNFYNTSKAREYDRDKNEIRRVVGLGLENFTTKEVRLAEMHYVDSVAKLAERLNKKGVVDGSDFTITTAKVGVNLEITINHGAKVTRAWTIIAEGAIQRPHYRYLVK